LSLAERFRRDGFYAPVEVLSAESAADLLARLDAVDPADTARAPHPWIYKSYLLLAWMNGLVRTPRLLDALEPILGPDILVISADIWVKQPGGRRYVSWHQDAQYYALEPMEVVNAWVALTDATPENGCLGFIPGSHRDGLLRHANRRAPDNMLSQGQTIDPPVDGSLAVLGPLRAGQASLHHGYTIHGSGPNLGGARRVGVAVKYMPASARPTGGPPLSAMLVRGRDHGTVRLERPPVADFDAAALDEHARAMAPHAATRYMHF
jgi:ectoine hydroxylase-related dioxygenase (phytanoyl-CoA dioxygenase family)